MAVTAPTLDAALPGLDPGFVSAFRTGSLTPQQVDAALPHDRSAAIFVLLQLSAQIAAPAAAPATGPHTPIRIDPPVR